MTPKGNPPGNSLSSANGFQTRGKTCPAQRQNALQNPARAQPQQIFPGLEDGKPGIFDESKYILE
jgi:hypothetical protein